MTNQELFEEWCVLYDTKRCCGEVSATHVWNAAWEASKIEINAEVRQKLVAYAVQYFKERDHARARLFLGTTSGVNKFYDYPRTFR